MKIAVILLSGGLDSATVLALAIAQGYTPHCISFQYGQRHSIELEKSEELARKYRCSHKIFDIPAIAGSALTDLPLHPSYEEGKYKLHPSYEEGQGEVQNNLKLQNNYRPFNNLNLSKAKNLRINSTEVEKIFWNRVRNKQIENMKFRRQEPLGNYIVDFICLEKKLIIELDGGQHSEQAEYDNLRDSYFQSQGYQVLRFWNNEIIENLDGVIEHIIQSVSTSPQPSPNRRGSKSEIPATYVPARNTIFLAFALSYAEGIGAHDIFIGVNAVDYSGYPDCRPEYIAAFQAMANLATKAGVEGKQTTIHTPLITLSKAEIIKLGIAHNVDYSLTSSCYDPDIFGKACGTCDSCRLRLKGFAEAGIKDPIQYVR